MTYALKSKLGHHTQCPDYLQGLEIRLNFKWNACSCLVEAWELGLHLQLPLKLSSVNHNVLTTDAVSAVIATRSLTLSILAAKRARNCVKALSTSYKCSTCPFPMFTYWGFAYQKPLTFRPQSGWSSCVSSISFVDSYQNFLFYCSTYYRAITSLFTFCAYRMTYSMSACFITSHFPSDVAKITSAR